MCWFVIAGEQLAKITFFALHSRIICTYTIQIGLEFPHVRPQALWHRVAYNFSRSGANRRWLTMSTSTINIRSSTNPRTRLSSTTKTLRPSNSHSIGESFRRTLFLRSPWLGTRCKRRLSKLSVELQTRKAGNNNDLRINVRKTYLSFTVSCKSPNRCNGACRVRKWRNAMGRRASCGSLQVAFDH